MTAGFSTFKSAGRATLVALALGGAMLAAAPARADSLSFQLGLGGDGSVMSFGIGTNDYKNNYHPLKKCLKDWQVESALEDYGFYNPQVVDHLPHYQVAAIGDWKGRGYDMKVDACTGEVYDVERRSKGTGGFGFQFSFGNSD